jgi:hypothetical protein
MHDMPTTWKLLHFGNFTGFFSLFYEHRQGEGREKEAKPQMDESLQLRA